MQGKRFRPGFRRRSQGKTDYRVRLALLKSKKTRAVVRKSLYNIRVQFIEYDPTGDKIIASAISSELKNYGWDGHYANAPASYLTGFLAGKKARKQGITEGILDIGLNTPTKGANIFCALNGLLDAGIDIPHGENMLPTKERTTELHIHADTPKKVDEIKGKIEAKYD